jgi:hypothetical protein
LTQITCCLREINFNKDDHLRHFKTHKRHEKSLIDLQHLTTKNEIFKSLYPYEVSIIQLIGLCPCKLLKNLSAWLHIDTSFECLKQIIFAHKNISREKDKVFRSHRNFYQFLQKIFTWELSIFKNMCARFFLHINHDSKNFSSVHFIFIEIKLLMSIS